MALEHVEGPGSIAMWDQGLAAAREALGKSCAFVLVTCERGNGQVDFAALSSGLSPAGMISLLDSAVEGALGTIPQLEEVLDG
jgi:hypothetical protein